MLILSRKQGESIVIDERTVVTVLQVGMGRVRIGVAAPGNVPVFRKEIHERILEERRASLAEADEALADEEVAEQFSAV